jgi:circadian clock protein KaiC
MTRKHERLPQKPQIVLQTTGVPGLDEVLGGGLPAYSFNLIAGDPGTGKTTLAMQVLFATATPERPGLYITLLGETSLKMMRYQQQFAFFDATRVGKDVHFLNLTTQALTGDLDAVLKLIVAEVEELHPGIVVVDSFRSLVRTQTKTSDSDLQLETFVQRLAQHLTTWEVSSFLIGEYQVDEMRNPVFTVADGILWLTQASDRNSVVRKMQVVKMRGAAMMPGLHTMRITDGGTQVFPRTNERSPDARTRGMTRVSTGIAGLDEMLGGGIPEGDSLILAGQTGTGKTTFAMQFAVEGLRRGESVVIAIFEEHPPTYLARAKAFGVDLSLAVAEGKLRLIYIRPLDLSVDETLDAIRTAVQESGAKRVVIDSISGFEMALAPTFRMDFRESLYRLIGALTGLGVTIYSTVEVPEGKPGLHLTGYEVSFLTDDIISQRYIEIDGRLRKALVVVKMRGSVHSLEFRAYDVTPDGVRLGETLRDFDAIMSGNPVRTVRAAVVPYRGLLEQEVLVLEMMARVGPQALPKLAAITGMDPAVLGTIVDRLKELGYVSQVGDSYAAESLAHVP